MKLGKWLLLGAMLLCEVPLYGCFFDSTFHDLPSTKYERQIIKLKDGARTRRSIYKLKTVQPSTDINYEFEAFQQNFNMNLTLDNPFSAPYIIQRGNISWIDTPYLSGGEKIASSLEQYRHCIYTGFVNGNPKSIGVADGCDQAGTKAVFLHENEEYYLRPGADDEHHIYRLKRSNHFDLQTRFKRPNLATLDRDSACATDTSNTLLNELYPVHNPAWLTSAKSRPHNTRSKRSVSREHIVELMIVADTKMAEYHGDGLEQYILSLIAVASRIYKDASLGNNVNLALVKLRIITDQRDGPNITSDAQDSLNNFCAWQYEENDQDDSHVYHHDAAVLLTRVDLCRSEGKCGTLGLAELGTVCNPNRSCAIIEDNGLSSAFTIAHEIGHVFGVPHDDSETCSEKEISGDFVHQRSYKENPYHLMSSTLDYKSQTWSWSECSRRFITKFLDIEDNIKCLADKPPSPLEYQQKLEAHIASEPGKSYDKNVQCEMVYGDGAKICPYMPVCRRLWCTLPDNAGCRTQHMPWADGTECGNGKWCERGACRRKSARPEPVVGQWSVWDGWTPCSRTCGGGVKFSARKCDNPSPQFGGKYCTGRRIKYKSCNTQACPPGPTFRELQCSQYSGRTFNNEDFPANPKYVPYYSEVSSEQCKLYCSVEGMTPNYYKLQDKVEDGTKCKSDGLDMCVNGVCMSAGCDNALSSGLTLDMCGVCGGDNSTCQLTTVSKTVYTTGAMTYGYNHIVTLPINASSVLITQTSIDDRRSDESYLAVSVRAEKNEKNYLFNGRYIVMMYGLEVKLNNGATVEFSGSDQVIEKIEIRGFISEEIFVEVLSVGSLHPANIYYSYVLPIKGTVSFNWAINDTWTECSSECRGERTKQLSCVREQDNLHVNEKHCAEKRKPSVKKEYCNLQCDIRWQVDKLEDCSANCGRGFIRRKITCIKQSSEGIQKLEENECTTPKPSNIEACNGKCSPTQWRFTDWSNCSKSCGGGVQTRDAKCALRNGRYVSDFACNRLEKLISRSCNTHGCTSYEVGEWGQCSVSCGFGTQSRSVVCLEDSKPAEMSRCGSRSPELMRTCNSGPCAAWQVSDWTDCTVTCGSGIRYREVKCMRSNQHIEDDYCPAETQPLETANCSMPIQCPDWVQSNWTACSQTCGREGIERRSVECKDHGGEIVPTFSCDMDKKPAETRECPKPDCTKTLHRSFGIFGLQNQKNYRWRYGGWASCSVSCGSGVKKRYVTCSLDSDPDKKFDDSFCWRFPKPEDLLPCRHAACGSWRTGSWSHCTSSCGEGVKSRAVACALPDGTYGTEDDCDLINKPEIEKPCEVIACSPQASPITNAADPMASPTLVTEEKALNEEITTNVINQNVDGKYWRTGVWSKCSATCDGGLRRRAVECYHGYSRSSGCDISSLPVDKEECGMEPCPTWRKGAWTKCSRECGYGTQQRMVVCQMFDGSIGAPQLCGGYTPDSLRDCVEKPCGNPVWSTSDWSQCSASCGSGEVIRNVTCVDSANTSLVLDSELCTTEAMPSQMETCIQSSCTKWITGDWKPCSGQCGFTQRTRDIRCVGLNERKLDDSQCDSGAKPASAEKCELKKCQYSWKTYEWSQCSKSCGEGIKIRSMKCLAGNGTEVNTKNCADKPPPNRMEACNRGECPVWRESEWDQCSVTCGEGQQLRLVECYNLTSQLKIQDQFCDAKSKPEELKVCKAITCPVWVTSKWSKCSGPCNSTSSVQTRQVQCVNSESAAIDSASCDKSTKPEESRRCQDCSFWREELWSRCSVSCGRGIQVRKLSCIGSDSTTRAYDECSGEVRPKIIQTCNIKPCASWTNSAWGQCSVSCGEGYRSRVVECVNDITQETLSDDNCDPALRPSNQLSCTIRQSCPTWATSLWGPCTATCGEGVQWRDLICVDSRSSVPVTPSLCDNVPKPTASALCKITSCNHWRMSGWTRCSVSCGEGSRSRNVTCSLPSGDSVPDNQCDHTSKPHTMGECSSTDCKSGFIWKSEKWSECSTACGYGTKTRRLKCISEKSRKQVPVYVCSTKTKPKEKRRCQQKHCPNSWWTDKWSKCSASCGEGRQFRKVLCKSVSPEGWYLGNSVYGCKMEDKPDAIRTCSFGPCHSNYVWQSGSWSKCDAVCGWGKEKRKVRCVTLDGRRISRSNCDIMYKPERVQKCYSGPCKSGSCSELRKLSGVREDGDYDLLIKDYIVSVYCHKMHSKEPKEYITLATGPDENYATIYGQRLAQPYSCPHKISRDEDLSPECPSCVSNLYQKAGETKFSRIRLNIQNFTVDLTDFQFARTKGMNYIGFASAGDCYSAKNCPQGRFSINLRHTGFRVSAETEWKSMGGPYTYKNIDRKKSGDIIRGRCGGYCGLCTPSESTGLKLEVVGNT